MWHSFKSVTFRIANFTQLQKTKNKQTNKQINQQVETNSSWAMEFLAFR